MQLIKWHITISNPEENFKNLSRCPWRRGRGGEYNKMKILTGFSHKHGGTFLSYRPCETALGGNKQLRRRKA